MKWTRPEGDPQPMPAAPRDGTKILVERVRTQGNVRSGNIIVPARWQGRCWLLLHTSGSYRGDEGLLHWWPYEEGVEE